MSVYKPAGSTNYYFDFQRGGRRFHGTTGTTRKSEAEAIERREKEKARETLRADAQRRGAPMTLDVAADRYWLEVGQFLPRPDAVEWSLAWLIRNIGKDTLIADISNNTVARIVAIRRGERVINRAAEAGRKRKKKQVEAPLVSPATVNRSVTEPLRKVLHRARDLWEQEVKPIRWREHILKEPRERVRSVTQDEEARLLAEVAPAYQTVVLFAIRAGFRISECCALTWDRIDWGELRIRVLGKGDKEAEVPMTTEIRDLLWRLQGNESEHVFTYAPGKPITPSGLRSLMRRAIRRAGLVDLRPFHDLRHTAATRLLRTSGNIKLVSQMLRDEQAQTTFKYAHATDQDLRAAMEAVEQSSAPASQVQTQRRAIT